MLVDAALAITLTLLMLDIRLPTTAEGMDDSTLAHALLAIAPRYFAYALSFLVIGRFWVAHRQTARHVTHGDAIFTWLNILFLLTLGLIPFVTSVIAENGGRTGTMVYAGVLCAVSLMLFLIWWYATARGLTAPDLPARLRRDTLVFSGLTVAIFAISIGIAWFNADAAKYFWLVLLLLPLLRHRPRVNKDAVG